MSERFKEHAWKACVGEILPGVRIPLSPPSFLVPNAFPSLGGGPLSFLVISLERFSIPARLNERVIMASARAHEQKKALDTSLFVRLRCGCESAITLTEEENDYDHRPIIAA